jgi:hypothetical protein
MKRIMVLALGLLFLPALVSAQVEVGLDAGLTFEKIDDVDDSAIDFSVPTSGARIAFAGGESMLIETLLAFGYGKQGDDSGMALALVPGLNFLLSEQLYLRGEAGLNYVSFDNGSGGVSGTQFLFGAGVGIRKPLSEAAVLRFEGALDRFLESLDGDIPFAASWQFRAIMGISAVVG